MDLEDPIIRKVASVEKNSQVKIVYRGKGKVIKPNTLSIHFNFFLKSNNSECKIERA